MNIPVVVQALTELSEWLECSKPNQKIINEIINELQNTNIDEKRRKQLKNQLSPENLFHPKWIGDVYNPNFVGDGTVCAWFNYLSKITEICQKNL